jgi:L-asparaginase/Glu-tRNA(Gln) amidotransferase subunit D
MTTPRPLSVLVVFTGGTISSRLSGSAFELSDAPYRLLERIPPDEFVFETFEAMHIFSENMTPDSLLKLFGAIHDRIDNRIFDGIILAHGTDTLAYTAQLTDILLSGLGCPVIVLGSKYPLDDPRNDGISNFRNALVLIREKLSGVFVVSRAENGTDYVHAAGKVMQAFPGTDDFQSFRGQIFGVIRDGVLEENPNFSRSSPTYSSCEWLLRTAALRANPPEMSVVVLDAVIGFNFQILDLTRQDYRYILQKTYHSGTACTAPKSSPYSLLYVEELCRQNFKRLFIPPVLLEKTPYSTANELTGTGITPVYDRPAEAVWAGLLLCTWLDLDPDDFFEDK